MTGRELIMYILTNGLENEPVIQDGRFIGLMTVAEAAAKMDVGEATVSAWVMRETLPGYYITGGVYIPAIVKSPIESNAV